jgi:hypothetical protein
MRGLLNRFIDDLESGVLRGVLARVKEDATLCLEIRQDYINIYYRGGNAIKIKDKRAGNYEFSFDLKYIADSSLKVRISSLPKAVSTDSSVMQWIDELPTIKNQMDFWFVKHPKDERSYQQLVVHENNYGGSANDTDYFICDIDYANENGRFDMVAVKWPSTSSQRKQNKNLGLALIEMKYMDKALTGSAGLVDHIRNMDSFLSVSSNLQDLKKEMIKVFNQKIELGLLKGIKEINSFNDERPEYILILANHDPDKSVLRRELKNIIESNEYTQFCAKAELKVATSCLMGYGLYHECIYPIDALCLMDNSANQFTNIVK